MHPERSDVSISKLFAWGNKFEIYNRFTNETSPVYIRLVGDAELNRARTFAIRKSREYRQLLRDKNSDEYGAFIASIYDIEDREQLIDVSVSLQTKNVVRDAYKEVQLPTPKEPKSTAELEEQEEFQAEVDSYDSRRLKAINEYVMNQLELLHKAYGKETDDTLRKLCERLIIEDLCEKRMVDVFKTCCTYYGSFSDAQYKKAYFESFDELENLPTEVKQQYLLHYSELDLGIDDLKESPVATQ